MSSMRDIRNTLARWTRLTLSYLWRRIMLRTTVIAITGSTGKTTAKECLAAALQGHGRTLKTFQNQNDEFGVPRTILAMRPWHRFAVVEVGTGKPGDVRRSARLLKPDIAIILRVGRTHTNKFRTLDDTAAEKSAVLGYLPRHGIAILNGDDQRVSAMAAQCRAKVLLFGRGRSCDYQAQSVESRWPVRLSFSVRTPQDRLAVCTRLVGSHWTGSVLAALAGADVCGVSVREAALRIGEVEPFMGRMQPIKLPGGAVVIRDEGNGSPDTMNAMLDVLEQAKARRRGLVFSDLSDSRRKPKKRLCEIGRIAAQYCDFAVFVGDHAHHAAKAAIGGGMDTARCREFTSLQNAASWLQMFVRDGDLVFLKGRGTDHLSRILFAQFGAIGCWKPVCHIRRPCDVCSELGSEFDLDNALYGQVS
jgi:UDP-N-acetylmuramoyl-tripeptide--D-alanyl-D-alanine ligase